MGRWRTQSLFLEMYVPDAEERGIEPIFTFKPEDYKGLPSMKKIYLQIADPTEYKTAIELLGYWDHWKKLLDCPWFMEHLDAWREELEIKLRSGAVKAMIETAQNEGSKGTNAAKWLADRGWKESKRGRFSKQELERERKIAAGVETSVQEDLERLGLRH